MAARNWVRTGFRVLIGAGVLALITWAIVYLLQPTGQEVAAAAARKRCKEHGWPEQLAVRLHSDTGSGLTQGLVQEFEIDGSDPRMAVWVEVRRPLYAPFWRVAQIGENKVDLDPD